MDELIARQKELMAPIEQQIMMTDDVNDVILLATNMFTTSILMFYQNYGNDAANLIDVLVEQSKNKFMVS